MPELSAAEAADQLAEPIRDIGGRWMLHLETIGHCRDLGYRNGFIYYVVGRGGVLGNCDADVVTAAFGFFAPSLVRTMWEGGVDVEGPRQASLRYGASCAAFGSKRLAGFANAGRYCELASKIVNGTDLSGMSLFAAWKNEPLPGDDVAGHAYFLTHVLRELRGSAHIIGVAATGLSPMQAVLCGPDGAAHAKQFGWGDEFPKVDHLAPQRQRAEEVTTEICTMALDSTLTPAERGEFVGLVTEMNGLLDRA
jgi:hypothetical protein